jgi:phage shock protein C
MFAGVAAGIADYFNVDPTLIRILLFLVLLSAGPFGLLIYAALAVIVPQEPAAGQDAPPQL